MSPTDTQDLHPALAKLVAAQEITQVKARYFRLMDNKQWDEWEQVFTLDAVVDMSGQRDVLAAAGIDVPEDGETIWHGRDKIRASFSSIFAILTSAHHGHMQEIEMTSATTANVIWAMEDVVLFPGDKGFRGYGHYHETYEQIDGRWFIKTLKLARLFALPLGQ
jgi:SnoaL-like domain